MGKGVGGDEGTGVTALYTHLRVSLDCYPLVTPLDPPIGVNPCSNPFENARLCAKPCNSIRQTAAGPVGEGSLAAAQTSKKEHHTSSG